MAGGSDKAQKLAHDETHGPDDEETQAVPTEEGRAEADADTLAMDDEVHHLLHDAFDEILDEEVPDRLKRIVARLSKRQNGGGEA